MKLGGNLSLGYNALLFPTSGDLLYAQSDGWIYQGLDYQ